MNKIIPEIVKHKMNSTNNIDSYLFYTVDMNQFPKHGISIDLKASSTGTEDFLYQKNEEDILI